MHYTYILFTVVLFIRVVSCFRFQRQGGPAPAVPGGILTDTNISMIADINTPEKMTTTVTSDYEDGPSNVPVDYFSYVALIDIVFQDGSKRTCSGAIIHKNAVITAAHCFTLGYQKKDIHIEITATFIVIGTKMMFESGYEQYFPIEKILTHPNYTGGWTADLALVFTFSGMDSDKPGRIIPLAGERQQIPVDTNITVLSWGKCREPEVEDTENVSKKKYYDTSSEEKKKKKKKGKTLKTTIGPMISNEYEFSDEAENSKQSRSRLRSYSAKSPSKSASTEEDDATDNQEERGNKNEEDNEQVLTSVRQPVTLNTHNLEHLQDEIIENLKAQVSRSSKRSAGKLARHKTRPKHNRAKLRRQMTHSNNNLTVEVFNFVNSMDCVRLIDKSMPAYFSIKNKNEVMCYKNEDHYITFEDSGAPALQQDHLLAVTVGGTEWDGEHVAVGMKMNCFCSWIIDNLPDTGSRIKCCLNCCDDGAKHRQRKSSNNALRSIQSYQGDNEDDHSSEAGAPSLYRRSDSK